LTFDAVTSVDFIGVDRDSGSSWRTASAQKPLDPDGDNVWGTDGWVVWQYHNDGWSGEYNPADTAKVLPSYISSISDPAHGWGGADTSNYGLMDDPLYPEQDAYPEGDQMNVKWNPVATGQMPDEIESPIVIERATSQPFRLGIILGSWGGDGKGTEDITIEAPGTNITVQYQDRPDDPPGEKQGPQYYLFDIGEGTGSITIIIDNNDRDNPGLTGLFFDSSGAGAGGGNGVAELPAPVSHWNFDDGQTVTDQVGANDGTVLKNVSFSTDTPDGSTHSIDLTGKDNYVRIGEASPDGPTFGIEETSSFTISAWVKYESSERGIVTVKQDLTSGGGDRSGMTLGINAKGNPFVGYIPCCDSAEFRDITTNQVVPTGIWTHLAATYDSASDTLAVYVNGEAATGYSSNSVGSPADDGSNATGGIGGFDWTDTNGSFTGFGAAGNAPAHGSSAGDFTRLFYSGLLDEVAIWSQALNADEIAGLAGAGAAAPVISIVNNGDGTVTVTFDGKLQAAPTVNGPWADVVGATSPLTIQADQAQQYGRTVSE